MGDEPTPQKKKGGLFRKLRTLVVGLVLLAVVGLALTQTAWGRARMSQLATIAIRDQLGLRADLGTVEVRLGFFPPSLVVHASDIVLDDPVYGRFVEADALTIAPSLGALIRGEVDLDEITITRPTVNLIIREGELRNLPRPRVESDPDAPTVIPFRSITLDGATVNIDAAPHAAATITDLDLSLTHDPDEEEQALRFALSGGGGSVRYTDDEDPISEEIRSVEGSVAFILGQGVDAQSLEVETENFALGVSEAFIPLPFSPDYFGNVHARADLETLRTLPLPFELPVLTGVVDAQLTLAASPGEDGARQGGDHADRPLEGSGHVQLRDVHIERYGLGEVVDLDVEFDQDRVAIPQMRFQLIRGGGTITGDAEISLDADQGLPLRASLNLDQIQFGKLIEQLGVTPNSIVWWFLTGPAQLRGTLSPLDLSGPIHLRSRELLITQDAWHERPRRPVLGIPRGRIDGRVTVTPEGLGFRDLDVQLPRTRARADVLLTFGSDIYVEATSEQCDLADVTPLAEYPLGGRGSFQASVRGEYGNPEVTGHIRFDDFLFDTFRAGTVESDFVLEEGGIAVRFPEVHAVKNNSRYDVDNLYIDFSDNRFEVTGLVRAQTMHLSDLYHIFRLDGDERFEPYQGVGHGTARVRFTTGFPGDLPAGTLTTDMNLRFSSANFAGFAFDDGELEATWRWLDYARGTDGAELEVRHLSLSKSGGTLNVAGTMGLGGVLQMSVAADSVPIKHTEGFEDMASLGGHWSFLGEIGGTRTVPHIHLDLGLSGLSWENQPLGDGRLYVRLTDRTDPWVAEARRWDAESPPDEPCANARMGLAQGRWAPDPPLRTPEGPVQALDRPMAFLVCGDALDERVQVDMAFGWTSRWPMRGVIELDEMDLSPILAANFGGDGEGDADVGGVIAGRIAFDDGALADDSYGGSIHLTRLEADAEGIPVRNDGDIHIDLERGTALIRQMVMTGPGTRLAASGEASMHRRLATHLVGTVDLGLLSTLSPAVTDAEGRVRVEVRVAGTAEDPTVHGSARVRGGAFRFAGAPVPIEGLTGDIMFGERRILFENFEARVGSGRMDMAGFATVRDGDIEEYAFDVNLRDVALRPMEGVNLGFDAQARLFWDQRMRLPKLQGDVQLERLVYSRPTTLSPTIGELNRPEVAAFTRYDPTRDNIEVELTISGRPIRVRNNLMTVDVAIADDDRPFQIVGTDQRLGVLGQLAVRRGTVRFRTRELDVRSGEIRFDDPTRVNPSFDVLAETDIRRTQNVAGANWRITLHAHGDLDAFRLDATSDPAASEQDILLLLTVGFTTAEAQQLQAADLGGAALEAVSSLSGVNDEVSAALPVIDDFAITTVYNTRTNRPEPQVTIGKRIADRVRLTASTGLTGDTREIRTGVEWQLGDQTSVQAGYDNVNRETQSSFGNLGVDFRWRLEFD